MLVARATPTDEVFGAVTAEAGQLLHADYASTSRYDPDGAITVVATWNSTALCFRPASAEALGGRRRLDSPPGAGTTLEITLPVGTSPNAA